MLAVVVWMGAWGSQVRVACRGVLECARWASQSPGRSNLTGRS